MDKETLIGIAEDLAYLRTWGGTISNAEIRRGSAIMRRLLVEGGYGQAWRFLGRQKQPNVIAVDLLLLVGSKPHSHFVFALAGGASFQGAHMMGLMMHSGLPPSVGPFAVLRPGGYLGEAVYSLSGFMGSPSGICKGELFTREEVVKYIANVRGGVHLGGSAKTAEKKLVERLSRIEDSIRVHQAHGLLVELVAIAQAVGGSEDAMAIVEQINALPK